ncbi:MAG: phytanoyl-CoA dioxygenase family protein [Pseudomonadota bacterium]
MPFNKEPLRPVTDAEREAYTRDGVVLLRDVFDPEWLESLVPSAKKIAIDGEDLGLLPSVPGRYMSRVLPEYRRFIFESPMAQAAAQAIGSSKATFYFEEFFAKPPKSDSKTIWHCDRMGWPVSGEMIPSLWIPLHDCKAENTLEVILGSHTQKVPYWLFGPNARKMIKPDDRMPHPNEEKLRADPSNVFKQWDMNIGDMLVLHPRVLHYSSGNSADTWRIAISARIFGDDVRWAPSPECINLAGVSFDEMVPGEAPQGPCLPLLWSEDGARDGDSEYPKGFSTRWSSERQDNVNEDALFQEMLKKQQMAKAS